jgi:hypothetical protein
MLPTHDVPCPSCGKALYSAVSLEDGVDAGAVESPKVEHDAQGHYMNCPQLRQAGADGPARNGQSRGLEA